jgi:hypothetical protein
MAAPWPDPEARERYIKFIELELSVLKTTAGGAPDPDAIAEFDYLLKAWFPRTRVFIESRLENDPAVGFSDEVRTVAWVEARAVPAAGAQAAVPGAWTESEIASDINDCFREARRRLGL